MDGTPGFFIFLSASLLVIAMIGIVTGTIYFEELISSVKHSMSNMARRDWLAFVIRIGKHLV